MDWLRTTTRVGGGTREQGAEELQMDESEQAFVAGSSSKPSSSLLAPAPFFGRTRRVLTTSTEAGASSPAAVPSSSSSSSSSFSTTLSEFGASVGEQLRGSSASLGALLKDASDAINLLPPPPAPAPVAGAAERDDAVVRAKNRLAGLRLVVLEQNQEDVTSGGCRPPFHVGPHTVVLATVADGGEVFTPEEGKDGCSIILEWFRSSQPGGPLTPIPGVNAGAARYRPTADDVGSYISVRASLLTPVILQQQQQQQQQEKEGEGGSGSDTAADGAGAPQPPPPFAVFAEAGPFALGEGMSARLQECLAGQQPVVFKGLREVEEAGDERGRHVYDLVVGPKVIELWSRPLAPPVVKKSPASREAVAAPLREPEPWSSSLSSDSDDDEDDGDDGSSSGGSSSEGQGEKQDGELLGRGPYSLETLVALHPHAPTVVLVQLPLFLLLDSSSPSSLPPEERSEQQQQQQQVVEPSVLLQRALRLESKEERDLLALLWRAWRREALQAAEQGAGQEEEGVQDLDAVLLVGSSLALDGRSPVVVARVSSGEGGAEQARDALLKTARLSSSRNSSSDDDVSGAAAAAAEEEEEGRDRGLHQQAAVERQPEEQQQGHFRRASSSGLGGLLMLGRRGGRDTGDEPSKEETIRSLRREVEALQRRVEQLEGLLEAANDEAAEACDQLAEAAARIASLSEEAEQLQVQEEALALQKTSNDQALALARGEMERLRAEAGGLREERDKDRAVFLGEMHGQALRLEAAESAVIEKERALAEARKELGWVHEQWAEARAKIAALEAQGAALQQELAAWEERETRRREGRRAEQERERQDEATNPFSPVSPGELLEESRVRCAAAEAKVQALEGQLAQEAAARQALEQQAEAAARGLAAEREHTAVLLGERNSFRQRADSLARELSRAAARSLSQSQSQPQPSHEQPPIPRSFDEVAARLVNAQAEAQRLREELEEVKALGAAAFSSATGSGAPGGDNGCSSSSGDGDTAGGPPFLRTTGVPHRKSSGQLSLFRLNSSTPSLPLPGLLRRERSGSGCADGGREAEMQQLLRSLTQSVQEKETQRARAAQRLACVEALAREAGLVLPPEEGGGDGAEERQKEAVLTAADV